jgi:hypothetical protein
MSSCDTAAAAKERIESDGVEGRKIKMDKAKQRSNEL